MWKILSKTPYLKHIDSVETLSKLETLLGGIIVRHRQNLACNSISVNEIVIFNQNDTSDCANNQLACAVYPTASLLSHACNEYTMKIFFGRTLIIRANYPIKKGEVVSCSYGECFVNKPKRVRQAELKRQFFFDCKCEACVGNWQECEDLMNEPRNFKCVKCQYKLTGGRIPDACPNCKTALRAFRQEYENGLRRYLSDHELVRKGKVPSDCIEFLVNFLKLLRNVVCQPSCCVADCQQTLYEVLVLDGGVRYARSVAPIISETFFREHLEFGQSLPKIRAKSEECRF
jgi:hypothetical protein